MSFIEITTNRLSISFDFLVKDIKCLLDNFLIKDFMINMAIQFSQVCSFVLLENHCQCFKHLEIKHALNNLAHSIS